MKVSSLHIGNNVIEARNNMWTGIETVYFNGRRVSRQFNWFVGIHEFEELADDGINMDYYRVEFRVNWGRMCMISADMYRNGECILNDSGVTNRFHPTAMPATDSYHNARRGWTDDRERAANPVYREEDLV